MRHLLLLVPTIFTLSACTDRSGSGASGGTLIVGASADADAILPGIAGTVQGRTISELLFDRLADIGPELNTVGDDGFLPRLASGWNWSDDSLSIAFSIDPKARWHDGIPVSASDATFTFAVIRNPEVGSTLANNLAAIDSVSATDSLTLVVYFSERNAEQFYEATQIVVWPEHIFASIPVAELTRSPQARAPIGSGRYRFVSWEPMVRLEIGAVEDHARGRAKLDRIIFTPTRDATSGLARVWGGETDIWEPLSPGDLPEAERYEHLKIHTGPGFDYGFMAFNFRSPTNNNLPHPLFSDRELRRALSMAIDRDAINRVIFDTLAVTALGPFVRAQYTADTTISQLPFDRSRAAAVLDSLGWRVAGSDSVRRRDNQRLAFTITVPTSSVPRNRAAVMMQEQFRQIGVDVSIETFEFQTFFDRMNAGRFDAVISVWRTTPSPRGIRTTWGSPAIAGTSRQNAGVYSNPEFDEAVMQSLNSIGLNDRKAHMRRAYQIAVDDAAAIWLFEIRSAAVVHSRYDIPSWRPDAWWLTVGEWSIDPDQRLPRDARPDSP